MQSCPIESTQIASVMVLNARNRKIYRTPPRTPLGERGAGPVPGSPAVRAFILWMSAFVTKLNLYPKNGHC